MKMKLRCVILMLASLLLLTACGGSSKTEAADYAYVETAVETTAAASYSTNYIPGAAASGKMEEKLSEMHSDGGLGSTTELNSAENIGRKLIRTIHLSVETYDFDALLQSLQDKITALSGYIEQSDVSGTSISSNNKYSRRRAYMTVRIPSTSLDQFVSSVETNGNVTNKSETTNDVTLQYSDLESRKKTLILEQDRIWTLLEKADTLEAVIALEERLSEIRYELESMESKLRLFDNQVEYSTVHINIEEVKVYTTVEPESIGQRIQNGFARNIENIKEFSIDLFVLVVTTSPIWIPTLIIILVLFFIVRKKIAARNLKNLTSGLKVSFDQEKEEHASDSEKDK